MIVISTVSWSSCLVSGVFSCSTPLSMPGDVPDLGRHPGRGDDHLAAAAGHLRVHVGHVDPVAERDVVARHRVDRFETGCSRR